MTAPDPNTGHPNTPYDVNLPEPSRPVSPAAPSIRERPSTPTPASRPIPPPVTTPTRLEFMLESARSHAQAIDACLAKTTDAEWLRRGRQHLAEQQQRVAWLERLVALAELRVAVPDCNALEQRLALAMHGAIGLQGTEAPQ